MWLTEHGKADWLTQLENGGLAYTDTAHRVTQHGLVLSSACVFVVVTLSTSTERSTVMFQCLVSLGAIVNCRRFSTAQKLLLSPSTILIWWWLWCGGRDICTENKKCCVWCQSSHPCVYYPLLLLSSSHPLLFSPSPSRQDGLWTSGDVLGGIHQVCWALFCSSRQHICHGWTKCCFLQIFAQCFSPWFTSAIQVSHRPSPPFSPLCLCVYIYIYM